MFKLKDQIMNNSRSGSADNFYEFVKSMDSYFLEQSQHKDDKYFDINDKAIIGVSEAVAYFYHQIENYLRSTPFKGNLPPVYSSLIEGLFHEWKGFSSAYGWLTKREYSESSGLQIIGKNIFYNHRGKFLDYKHKLVSLDRLDQLKRALLSADETANVTREDPSEEFKLDDPLWPGRFIRIAMWAPPRTWEGFTTISMRRQIVEFLTFEQQAATKSIPLVSVKLWHLISALGQNFLFCGPVGAGKSTFANSYVGEKLLLASKSDVSEDELGLVLIERHAESTLPYVFKDQRILPVIAKHHDLMNVGIESLRMDPNIIFMSEMRHYEWEFFIWAGSKGYDDLVGTFHTIDAEDIPYQAAMAVQTIIGGSLKGHLISALESCRIVAIMEKLNNGEKRVTRLAEVVYDAENNEVYANDLMRWSKITDSWTYNCDVSQQFRDRMQHTKWAEFELFMDELTKLAKMSPMTDPRTISKRSRMVLND